MLLEGLTKQVTFQFLSARTSIRWLPMKPVAPVTKAFICIFFGSLSFFYISQSGGLYCLYHNRKSCSTAVLLMKKGTSQSIHFPSNSAKSD